jgi:3'-phosphoadenosine 5'-phosphosulfate sulfotransferase (PAPS reductase)/FAD synthetase
MKDITASLALIDEATKKYKHAAVFALFSGGDDSMTACTVAFKHPKVTAALHLDTGTGVPETQVFVKETCKKYGWPLLIYKAKDCGEDYAKIVVEHGFPGPCQHKKMYIRLKERPLRVAMREAKIGHKRNDQIILISGARSEESTRRMGHVEPIFKEKGVARVWVANIHDWTKRDCLDYLEANGVERSPVAAKIHKSGECLCGAYAAKGELKELEFWYPEVAAQIRELECKVMAAGKNWGWGQIPPQTRKKKDDPAQAYLPLCNSCPKRVS